MKLSLFLGLCSACGDLAASCVFHSKLFVTALRDSCLSAVKGSLLQPKQTICKHLSRSGRENLRDV